MISQYSFIYFFLITYRCHSIGFIDENKLYKITTAANIAQPTLELSKKDGTMPLYIYNPATKKNKLQPTVKESLSAYHGVVNKLLLLQK